MLLPHLEFFARESDTEVSSEPLMKLRVLRRALYGADLDAAGIVELIVKPTTRFRSLQFTRPAAFNKITGVASAYGIPLQLA